MKPIHSRFVARLVSFLALMSAIALCSEYHIGGKVASWLLGSVFLLLLFQAYCGLAAGLVCGSVNTVKRVLQYTRRGAGSAPPQEAEIVPASRPHG